MERGIITISETGVVTMPTAPVWMTQFEIADLFGVFSCDIRKAIHAIYKNKELNEVETMKYVKQANGISYDVYSLEMVIAVAFRVCSKESMAFRQFVMGKVCAKKNETQTMLFVSYGKSSNLWYCFVNWTIAAANYGQTANFAPSRKSDSGARQSVGGAVAVRQHPFDVEFTVEDFATQLDVGYPPLVAVVLKRPAAYFQTCRHFLVGKETLAARMGGHWQVAKVSFYATKATEGLYCAWYNPFNQQKMYISFKKCKVVVFWTKNPKPILPYLHELDERGIHYYFQVTLNDYVKEGFEPNVSSVDDRVETFKKLSDMIGKERVIWRFDPLIITPNIAPRDLLTRIWHIGNKLKGYTNKLVFSFVDVKAYRKVQNNLVKETMLFTKENVENAEANLAQRIEIVEGLQNIREAWHKDGWDVEIATCAEDIDLEAYGIEHNCCIDRELMKRIFADDKGLAYYLHTLKWPERDMFGNLPPIPLKTRKVKDSGQRKVCGCMVSKDIGMYNTCRHFCIYCYANTSKECVIKNAEKYNEGSESIIG